MKAIAIRCTAFIAAALVSFGAYAVKNNPSAGNNGIQGTIRATDSTCTVINGTGYASKDDVYVKAASSNNGGSMLTDGAYFVRVTDTSGNTILGSSGATAIANVLAGKINGLNCVKLDLLVGGSYQDTPNPGGNYKVWFGATSDFAENTSKTDVFKVGAAPQPPDVLGSVTIAKFYDANVNGNYDDGELTLSWKVQLDNVGTDTTPVTFSQLVLGDYTAREFEPAGNSVANPYAWVATNAYQIPGTWNFDGPNGGAPYLNEWATTLTTDTPNVTVVFGNVCIGPATGGRSIGYWTNKNGQNDMKRIGMAYALANLGLLVNASGHYVTFTTYSAFQTWLKSATATNMSYMLSAQKVALKLAVLTGTLNYSDNIYAPGAPAEWGANPAGFISIGQLLAYTENQLSLNPYVRAGIPLRTEMQILKNAIERIDLNKSAFAQPTPDGCGALSF